MPPDDDALAHWLVRRYPPRGGGGAGPPCPDPDLLAGFAEGRLPEEGRGLVGDHVASCPECRTRVADLVTLGVAPAARAPARRTWLVTLAIAAVLLVGVGLGLILATGSAPVTSSDSDGTLVARAHELAAARPDLFAGFEPMSHAERTAPAPTAVRGGLVLGFPSGVLLYPRPTFRWTPMPAVAKYHVSVIGPDGKNVWTGTTSAPPIEYPPDAPPLTEGAKYSWEVSAQGRAGTVTGTLGFALASPDEAARAVEAGRLITSRFGAAEGLGPLMFAHWLARHELWEAAEAQLRSLAGTPAARDSGARELSAYVRARMGGPTR